MNHRPRRPGARLPCVAPGPFNLVLLAASALVSTLVGDVRAAEPGYPRLGLYGHILGRGEPLIRANGTLDPALLDAFARRHTVVLDATPLTEYRPDALAAIRARRPDIRLLGYVQAQHIYPSSQPDSTVNLPTRIRILVRNQNGFLYDRTGEEFRNANINLAKRNAQGRFVVAEALADFFVDHVLFAGDWDGLYFDRFCNSILWDQAPGDSIDFVRAGYPSIATFDAAWLAATDTLANRMRRRAGPSPILVGNCGIGSKYASFNGWMRENFPLQCGGSWETNVIAPASGYLPDQARYRAPSFGWMTSWPAPLPITDRENLRRARFTLGSATLGEGYGTLNPSDIDPATGYLHWWFDEYGVNPITGNPSTAIEHTGWLGAAKGPATTMVWAQPNVEDACDLDPSFELPLATGWTVTTTNGAVSIPTALSTMHGLLALQTLVPTATGGPGAVRVRSKGDVLWIADTYSATFWAKASSPRTIEIAAINAGNGNTYVAAIESLGTTWKRHQVRLPGTFGFARLEFRLGGTAGTVWLDDAHLQRGAPYVYRRDFDQGILLLNPGTEAYEVVLEKPFRRIRGIADPLVNDGISSTNVIVPAGDAMFLLKSSEAVVDVPAAGAPRAFAWASVTPNPSRSAGGVVRLSATGAPGGPVACTIHDAAGRLVRRFEPVPAASGEPFVLAWDGRDDAGRRAPAGVYFVRAAAGAQHAVTKLVRTD